MAAAPQPSILHQKSIGCLSAAASCTQCTQFGATPGVCVCVGHGRYPEMSASCGSGSQPGVQFLVCTACHKSASSSEPGANLSWTLLRAHPFLPRSSLQCPDPGKRALFIRYVYTEVCQCITLPPGPGPDTARSGCRSTTQFRNVSKKNGEAEQPEFRRGQIASCTAVSMLSPKPRELK